VLIDEVTKMQKCGAFALREMHRDRVATDRLHVTAILVALPSAVAMPRLSKANSPNLRDR